MGKDKELPSVLNESPVHEWFGLSYSSYLVIPRTLLQGMSTEWQQKLVDLLHEAEEVYDTEQIDDQYNIDLVDSNGNKITDPFSDYRHPPTLPYRDESKQLTVNNNNEV